MSKSRERRKLNVNYITLLEQEKEDDCGLACVAMITNKPYDKVVEKFKKYCNPKTKGSHSTGRGDLKLLTSKLGVKNKSVIKEFKSFETIDSGLAIIGVDEYKDEDESGWHWIVLIVNGERKFIADPADASFKLLGGCNCDDECGCKCSADCNNPDCGCNCEDINHYYKPRKERHILHFPNMHISEVKF